MGEAEALDQYGDLRRVGGTEDAELDGMKPVSQRLPHD
jgi:hypothetical protein